MTPYLAKEPHLRDERSRHVSEDTRIVRSYQECLCLLSRALADMYYLQDCLVLLENVEVTVPSLSTLELSERPFQLALTSPAQRA